MDNHTTNAPHQYQKFCYDALQKCVYTGLGGGEVLSSDIYANILQWVGLVILWYYCRGLKTRNFVNKSQSEVAKELLLPFYHLCIRIIIVVTIFWTCVNMLGLFSTQLAGSGQIGHSAFDFTAIITGINWGMYHSLFDFILFLLLYPGFGRVTIIHAAKVSLLTGCISGVVIGYINYSENSDLAVMISLCWDLLYDAIYLFIWLWPSQKISCCCTGKHSTLYRRPAARSYAMWWFLIRTGDSCITLIYDSKFVYNGDDEIIKHQFSDNSICGHFLFAWLLWGIGWPIILIKTFRRDTIYWSGGFNDCESGPCDDFLNDLRWLWSIITCKTFIHPDYEPSLRTLSKLPSDDIRVPLFEVGFSASESATVREGLDVVPSQLLIRFCELSLDSSVVLGSGGTARVFVGEYEKKKVAIKLIMCFEL